MKTVNSYYECPSCGENVEGDIEETLSEDIIKFLGKSTITFLCPNCGAELEANVKVSWNWELY